MVRFSEKSVTTERCATPYRTLIDLDRYPIDDLHGRGVPCVTRLRDTALCHLPGFVRADAVAQIRAEAIARHNTTYWMRTERHAYSWRDPNDYPAEHSVATVTPNHIDTITTDAFDPDSAFLSLFQLPALAAFLRATLGGPSLYPVACPHLAANVKVMGKGCKHAWHFDQNESAVTSMIPNARQGGHYEYMPYLRSENHENYEAVANLLRGQQDGVVREDLYPGSFCLFKGRRSIHRVTEVIKSEPDRLLAVFSYHTVPNHHYRESTVRSLY